MRVVIDPNVLVSAAVATGVSAQLIDRWLSERAFEVVVCPRLIAELRDVLARDKFRRWIASVSSRASPTRSLSRYARPSEPVSNSAVAYPGSTCWLSTTTPTSDGQR